MTPVRASIPLLVVAATALAACARIDAAAPAPPRGGSAAAGTIADEYLGSGPPSAAPAAGDHGPREFNPVERWIADHIPWAPPGLGR